MSPDAPRITLFLLTVAILLLAGLAGCSKKEPPTVIFYCTETFRPAMREAALVFQSTYEVRMVLLPVRRPAPSTEETPETPAATSESARATPAPWRHRPQSKSALDPSEILLDREILEVITSFEKGRLGNMFLTDSVLEQEELKKSAQVLHEYPFCQLTLTLFVAKGNPLSVDGLKSFLDRKLRLGITEPSKDGMGLEALKTLSGYATFVSDNLLQEGVRTFDRQEDLLRALEHDEVDGILAWDAVGHRAGELAEAVPPADSEKQVDVVQSLYGLRIAEQDGPTKRFADFLLSNQGRRILRKHGFVPRSR